MVRKVRRRPVQESRSASLKREQAVFEANLSEWLSGHEGEYVLIKGDQVDGFYMSRDERGAYGRLLAVRHRTTFRKTGLAF